jgi:hypothetical protein
LSDILSIKEAILGKDDYTERMKRIYESQDFKGLTRNQQFCRLGSEMFEIVCNYAGVTVGCLVMAKLLVGDPAQVYADLKPEIIFRKKVNTLTSQCKANMEHLLSYKNLSFESRSSATVETPMGDFDSFRADDEHPDKDAMPDASEEPY